VYNSNYTGSLKLFESEGGKSTGAVKGRYTVKSIGRYRQREGDGKRYKEEDVPQNASKGRKMRTASMPSRGANIKHFQEQADKTEGSRGKLGGMVPFIGGTLRYGRGKSASSSGRR